ncbi:trehalase family glycosidase [Thioclava kandeliae]|uniref:Trehalase family glycosidase n=1 Tax=Thioclava kandeliae TaxID=3070818 RepID=A0ABV1SE50_9RHOB
MDFLDQRLSNLFIDLQRSGLWEDEKAIADSVLLRSPAETYMAYTVRKSLGDMDLRAFYDEYFRPVRAREANYQTDPAHGPQEHIEALWPLLVRDADDPDLQSSRIALNRPYVVVGGRFQESYYWDTFFTLLGLIRAGRMSVVEDMLENFADAIERFGFVPNGFRTYYLSRSQPPFFWAMVRAAAKASPDPKAVMARYLPALEKEYRFWTASPRTYEGLARYWDAMDTPRIEMFATDLHWQAHAAKTPGLYRNLRAACESGWDFSSRWLADPDDLGSIRTTRIWPVDLNALLLCHETYLAEICTAVAPERAALYRETADWRAQALRERFYNPETGFFHDRLIDEDALSPVVSAAGLFPLFAGAATRTQAARCTETMQTRLLARYGLLSTDITSGQQWDAPNGWAPLQWIAIHGLRRYGYNAVAERIKSGWITACEDVFAETGKFVEKYNVLDDRAAGTGGEYELQDGFGWTNGVYLDLVLEGSAQSWLGEVALAAE